MVAVVVMAPGAEVNSGEGEGEGGAAVLKQASSELSFSTVIMPKRSRPEGAALVPPSEGAKGSLVVGWGVW